MFPEGRILDFLLVGVIALIVVGPKDLPVLMRRVGEFVGKMRAMAAEFRASFDEMARQSELEELRKEVEAMRVGQGGAAGARSALGLGADTPAGQVLQDIDSGMASGAGPLQPPTGYGYPAGFEAAPQSGAEAGPDVSPAEPVTETPEPPSAAKATP